MKLRKRFIKNIGILVLFSFTMIQAFGANSTYKAYAATGVQGKAEPANIERQLNQEFTVGYTFTPERISLLEISGITAKAKEIVLVIDTSGSMAQTVYGKQKLSTMKDVAKNFIQRFRTETNVKIGLVSYNDSAQSSTGQLSDISGFDGLVAQIDQLSAGGSTNIGDGLRKAYFMLKSGSTSANKYIILMTDGAATAFTAKQGSVNFLLPAAKKVSSVQNDKTFQVVDRDVSKQINYDEKGYLIYKNTNKVKFKSINSYQFETGNGGTTIPTHIAYYTSSYGEDYNQQAQDYATQMGGIIKKDSLNISSTVIGFGYFANSSKLSEIAQSVGTKCITATNSDDINRVYSDIANQIASTISVPASPSITIPQGIEITKLPDGLTAVSNVISGKVQNVNYVLNNGYYEAQPLTFSINYKINTNKATPYTLSGSSTSVSYTMPNGTYKHNFNDVAVAVKGSASSIKAPMMLSQKLPSGKIEYKVEEGFKINYTIDTSQGINKADYNALYKRQKEIVLVIDTSGSMAYTLSGTHPNSQFILDKVNYKGTWYTVQSYDANLKTVKFNNNTYTIQSMDVSSYTTQIQISNKWYQVQGHYLTSDSRMSLTKNAAISFINSLAGDQYSKIGIVSYSSDAEVGKPLTEATKTSELISEINGLNPSGGTNIGDGIRKANSLFSGADTDKYIILMTDGIPTAFTSLKSGLVYSPSIFSFENKGQVWENGDLVSNFKSISKYALKKDNSTEAESCVVNYGDNDYNNISMEYAMQMSSYAKSLGIKSFIIGFSNGINSDKLIKIANSASGYYKEASDGNALKDIYDKIASEIKLPVVKSIRFEVRIPQGLVIDSASILSGAVGSSSVYVEDDGKRIVGTFDNIIYDAQDTLNYKTSLPQIVVEANARGIIARDGYKIGNTENPAALKYIDIDGSETVKPISNEQTINIKNGDAIINVTKFGVFSNKQKSSMEAYIEDGTATGGKVTLLNAFAYELGSVLDVAADNQSGIKIDKVTNLDISTTGLSFVGNKTIRLYGIIDSKLAELYSWKNATDNNVVVPANVFVRGSKYILTQDFKPNVLGNSLDKTLTLTNKITVNKSKINTNNLSIFISSKLPNID